MGRLVLGLAIIAIVMIMVHKVKQAKGRDKKRLIFYSVITGIVILLVALAITGKLQWIHALIGAVVALIPKILNLLRYIPVFNKVNQHFRGDKTQTSNGSHHHKATSSFTREEAYEVLGLRTGANNEEIIRAHKKMMQKVHPDRGGSDFLASKINQAKDKLLS